MALIKTATAIIAAGGSLSGQTDIFPAVLVGIVMPAAWTAASLTFQVSPDGGITWAELYAYAGAELTLTVGAGQFLAVDPTQWKGVFSLKARSGTAASPVAQSAAAALTLILREMLA